jgi:hypothetical protein
LYLCSFSFNNLPLILNSLGIKEEIRIKPEIILNPEIIENIDIQGLLVILGGLGFYWLLPHL